MKKSIFLFFAALLCNVSAWALGYNNESHVYLKVNGTTKYYKVSTEDWSTGSSLPGTWGGELKSQTFNSVSNLQITGGAVGGWTNSGEKLSATLSFAVTQSTNTPTSWTNFGSISTNHSTYSGNNAFYYKNDGTTNVTPTTPGTYYLHIKISFNSTSKTSYAKFVVPDPLATNVFLVGEMNDWNTTRHEFRKTNDGDATASVTINLTAGTYSFKLMTNGAWKGNTGTMQRGGDNVHTGGWEFNEEGGDEKNCKITADVSGNYTFTWNITGKKLTVSYPKFPDLSGQPNTIYFKPSVAWKSANARFAAFFFQGETPTERWADLTDTDGDGIYEVSNNKQFISVIFVRMNPAHNTNKWENDYNWNQTADLVIPTNGDDRYTMTATGASNFDNSGKWSLVKHTISATADPVEGGSVEGANTYNYGTSVTLTATANDGYEFTGWSNGETANPYTFTATENITLTANFEKILIEIGDGDNSEVLNTYKNQTVDVKVNRTFKANDGYYTICLPFDLPASKIGTAYQVTSITEHVADQGFYMVFDKVQNLEAGQPYLILPNDLTNPTFEDVTITYTDNGKSVAASGAGINFEMVGVINGGGQTEVGQYWVGDNGYFYNGDGTGTTAKLGLRVLFNITDNAGTPIKIRARVVLGENAATSLDNITNGENTTIKVIENGQLIIIRDGEKFNAQGVRF